MADLDCVVSVSGIRGLVGSGLNPGNACLLGGAVGTALAQGGPVILGRDSRPTGALLATAIAAGLRGVGCDVLDLGIVPTPTVPFTVARCGAAAGIQVSASHNPVAWNALKCYTARARNVDGDELAAVLAAFTGADLPWAAWDGLGVHRVVEGVAAHLDAVCAGIDLDLVRQAGFTVLVDSVNGSGAVAAPTLLDRLGCRVVPLYTDPTRLFPRDPEPTAANVRETGAVVGAVGAAVGFVQDPDADRLALIDERGRYVGEEYTLALCAAARLAAAGGGVVCTNRSTSGLVDHVAAAHGGRVERTPVGEAHVLDAMERTGAVIGGEGNGGVVDPRVVWCRDSQVGMALVLEYLARTGEPLSALVDALPCLAMVKEKLPLDRQAAAAAADRLRASPLADGAEIDSRDGLWLGRPEGWIHLRPSGTEPVSRLITEGRDGATAADLAARARAVIGVEALAGH